ncbi:hypothetical protein T4C_6253 [Trichinella pseudospiralis]|uniref:Uncharacterized protein n=1 Tax=Trichinella pseudospiralis TaxID=6337 RepID=A0A0V1JWA4_TRIPS|nr:hypothetical protein T4C_6253 [Trichinella pseudospiralis]
MERPTSVLFIHFYSYVMQHNIQLLKTKIMFLNGRIRKQHCKTEFNRFERIYHFTRSKLFAALSVRSSSSNSHYFNVCVEYQPFLSTDTDLINLIRFLWFLFSHTVSTLYTGIKQDSSSRGLLGSSKKYTIVFVHVIPYVNSKFKRTMATQLAAFTSLT